MGDSRNRNKKCGCGSGKKYKHCCLIKKNQITTLKFDLGEKKPVVCVQMLADGSVQFLTDSGVVTPSTVTIETYYNRDKGPKITTKTIGGANSTSVNASRGILKYDKVFAVDTGTIVHCGEKISVTAIMQGKKGLYCGVDILEIL